MPEPRLHRDCAPAGEDCGRRSEQGGDERLMVGRAGATDAAAVAAPPSVREVLRTPGRPLEPSTRKFMEARFGHDFSRVRIHTDARAAASARTVGALAYTAGRDVAFATGQFAPGTAEGRRLLAHELTHTLQQTGEVTVRRQPGVNAEETPPFEETPPEQVLEDLKNGKYDFDAEARHRAARQVLIAGYAHQVALSPADEQLLVGMTSGERSTQLSSWEPLATVCHVRTEYTAEDVAKAAWNIVQNEQSVKDAFLFFGRIKSSRKADRAKWEEELARFFVGEYKPRIRLRSLGVSGETPNRRGLRKHKKIRLHRRNSFSVAVSTYLHEMAHYMDIWYSSRIARKLGKHKASAEGRGALPQRDKTDDPTRSEQESATREALTAIIEQILKDMVKPEPQPNEHIRVRGERRDYQAAKNESGFDHDTYVEKRRLALREAAADKYLDWDYAVEDGEIVGKKLELGYAFEKAAYGFNDEQQPGGANSQQENGEWAVGFQEKFERAYCKYLQ